jgi:hypothetical protein
MEPSGMAAKAGPAVRFTCCWSPVSVAVPELLTPLPDSPMVIGELITCGTTKVPLDAVTVSGADSVPVAVPVNVEAMFTVQEPVLTVLVVVGFVAV